MRRIDAGKRFTSIFSDTPPEVRWVRHGLLPFSCFAADMTGILPEVGQLSEVHALEAGPKKRAKNILSV